MGATGIRDAAPEGARVTVELDWDTLEPEVTLAVGELAEAGRRAAWEKGAVYGVGFALEAANALPCSVRITEIAGAGVETTPTVVAAAAAEAIWLAIGFAPPADVRARIARSVERGRRQPLSVLARFDP